MRDTRNPMSNLITCTVVRFFYAYFTKCSISLCIGFRPFPETDYNFTNLLNRIDDATLSLFEPHLTIRLTYTQVILVRLFALLWGKGANTFTCLASCQSNYRNLFNLNVRQYPIKHLKRNRVNSE